MRTQSGFTCRIFTSDNRMLSIYKNNSKVFKLKPINYNRSNVKTDIVTHEDGTISLLFHNKMKTYSCWCDRVGEKPTLKVKCVSEQGNFDKRFCFIQKGESDRRIYFESCAIKGWFIHSKNNVVTIDNNNHDMEAKRFRIREIEQAKVKDGQQSL